MYLEVSHFVNLLYLLTLTLAQTLTLTLTLDDHFRRLQTNDLNLDLPGSTLKFMRVR